MTAPIHKPISEDNLNRFKAYKEKHGNWKHLSRVLYNRMVTNKDVAICMDIATQKGDREGCYLVGVLMTMSKSQRIKLTRQVP